MDVCTLVIQDRRYMNIDTLKKYIFEKKNQTLQFKYNGNRGISEEFVGVITQVYNRNFLINDISNNRIRSFSLSDLLIGNLVIIEC